MKDKGDKEEKRKNREERARILSIYWHLSISLSVYLYVLYMSGFHNTISSAIWGHFRPIPFGN